MSEKLRRNKNWALLFTIFGLFFFPVIIQIIAIVKWDKCIKLCKSEKETNKYVFGMGFSYFYIFWQLIMNNLATDETAIILTVIAIALAIFFVFIHCGIIEGTEEYQKNKKSYKKSNNAKKEEENIETEDEENTETDDKEKKNESYKDTMISLEELELIYNYRELSEKDKDLINSIIEQRKK